MKTKHTYKIQYADADASRHIRLCDLERYLLEAGGESADIMGIGTDFLVEKYDCAWVLTRMSVVMNELPCYLDTITIETWVEQNAHMLSIRNYRIYLNKGDQQILIGCCNSQWTLLNLTTRLVDMRCFADPAWESIIDGEKLDLPRAPRLARIVEPTSTMQHTIHYTDLDYNNHCNSCKYTQFMLNACDSLTAVAPIRLDINYSHEVHKGEHITVDVEETPSAVRYCILTEQGEISCTGMISRI
ncbi:MAG: hypothetical protein IJS13_00890 [Paludibacteraceae bacterium]|nr:hypothetical protein [Paludibacteraceae bacterium]